MDFISIYKDMVKDTLTFRNYKRMTLVSAIFAGIVVIPFSLIYALTMLVYGLLAIWHKMINAPTDYLLAFVKGEGKDVKHATQAVVYLIGFPLIFILKAITCFIVFTMGILHFVASVAGYIATLGGMTFSPFILDPADRTAAEEGDIYPAKRVKIFVGFGLALFLLTLFYAPIAANLNALIHNIFVEIGMSQGDAWSVYSVLSVIAGIFYLIFCVGYVVFTVLYVMLVFRKKNTQIPANTTGVNIQGNAAQTHAPAEAPVQETEGALV